MASTLTISSQLTYAKARGYLPAFTAAANQTGIDRNLLLAVASRESCLGMCLDLNFLGDGGDGIGLMQIDRDYHPAYANLYDPQNHRQNVLQGAQILQDELQRYGGNRRYALAAYNAGSGAVDNAVNRGLDPDAATTGRDYSRDVLARYRLLKNLGGQHDLGPLLPAPVEAAPEAAAQQQMLLAGGALLVSAGITSYIIAKRSKVEGRKSKVEGRKSKVRRP